MDDFDKFSESPCTELERLAAAAVTMRYSDTDIPCTSAHSAVVMEQSHSDYSHSYVLPHTDNYDARAHHTHFDHHGMPDHNHILDHQSMSDVINVQQQQYTSVDNYSPVIHYGSIQSNKRMSNEFSDQTTSSLTNNSTMNYDNDAIDASCLSTPAHKNVIRFHTTNKTVREENTNTNSGLGTDLSKKCSSVITKLTHPLYKCSNCTEQFYSEFELQQHIAELHSSRRSGLALEVKIEIIKRINSGEKQSDIGEEYGLKRSTIKSIMLKSKNYLSIWKKGSFHPDSKRLKGPKREDVEQALYIWYQQCLINGTPVTGSILCSKAVDFALKLGHDDFKATHGWLDRFKKRNNIVFGRSASKKRHEESEQQQSNIKPIDWHQVHIPQILTEYQPNDIFSVDEIGLLYKASPASISNLSGTRCAAGVMAKKRLSVVLCANSNGSEKFPLLVVGHYAKPASIKEIKSLPVQYTHNSQSWLTEESFNAWLHDIDSWCIQQGREICLIASNLPIHKKPLILRAVKLIIAPVGLVGPLRHGAITSMKSFYRRSCLETLLSIIAKEKSYKSHNKQNNSGRLSLLTTFDILATAWMNVSEVAIHCGFQTSGLAKYSTWGGVLPSIDNDSSFGATETIDRLRDLGLRFPDITFKDLVHFDDKVQCCNLMDDDDILAYVKKEEVPQDSSDDEDDLEASNNQQKSNKPSPFQVEKALETVKDYIKNRDKSQEMSRVFSHLETLLTKKH